MSGTGSVICVASCDRMTAKTHSDKNDIDTLQISKIKNQIASTTIPLSLSLPRRTSTKQKQTAIPTGTTRARQATKSNC